MLICFSFCVRTIAGQTGEIKLRPGISSIVHRLEKEEQVHFGYAVGFSGIPETNNKYYKLYLKLKRKATNGELVLLTKDKFTPVVIYSFAILHARKFENLKSIFLEHLNDTTFYWTASGCTGFIERVNAFMLRRMKPGINGNDNYLSREEYDAYCALLKEQDNLFSCN